MIQHFIRHKLKLFLNNLKYFLQKLYARRYIYVRCFETTTLKAHYLRGAPKWFPCGNVTENSSFAKGTFGTFNLGASSDIVAIFYDYDDNNDTGHLTEWKIAMDRGKSYSNAKWTAILAHEIGHVYGLNDLYNDSNKDKLMYGYSIGTATGPTSSDIK